MTTRNRLLSALLALAMFGGCSHADAPADREGDYAIAHTESKNADVPAAGDKQQRFDFAGEELQGQLAQPTGTAEASGKRDQARTVTLDSTATRAPAPLAEPKPMDRRAERRMPMEVPAPVATPPAGPTVTGMGGLGQGRSGGVTIYGNAIGANQPASTTPPPPPAKQKARMAQVDRESGADDFRDYGVNPWTSTEQDRLSTFSVDVDTASYTIARRNIREGRLPPSAAVRVEEFLNYFKYSYPEPEKAPFSVTMDAAPSPFEKGRVLMRVGVQGRKLALNERKPAHLVFLVDVSGSMSGPDRLPLAKRSLRYLVDSLRDGDTVALVTYAGAVREVLPPTGLEKKAVIHQAIEDLQAGGSTAMSSGIELAYKNALKTLSPDSNTRVIVLSDGDANVGRTSHEEILKLIKGHVSEGVTLTTVGFGMGNYKDTLMEQLADKGNGNAFYVDGPMAAKRIFQEQLGGTLEVIAQDVKLQVDFNQEAVSRYRLVGYENRDIRDEDFRNDKVDAGEIGSGHSVTALYELELKEQRGSQSLATVRIRAKKPRGEKAEETAYVFEGKKLAESFEGASQDLRFATAVMAAAEVFRQSPNAKDWSLEQIRKIAKDATPPGNAEREEFLDLLATAQTFVGKIARR